MTVFYNAINSNARLWQLLCALVAIFTCIFYCIKLQPGHDWGDDFSQYIGHARNIVTGTPYKEIGYLPNPYATIAPETYPMVFPLLLAPLYAVFGINLLVFKVLVVFCFAGALFMVWPVFKPHLPPFIIFLITAVLALNPGFYLFKENILSEFPFLFFLLLCFFVMEKALGARNTTQTWLLWGLTGLCLFLVVGTRSAGIVLVPAWIGAVFMRKSQLRTWLPLLGISLLIFLALYFLQIMYLNSDGESYISQFQKVYTKDTISLNLDSYYQEAGNFWEIESKPYIRKMLLNSWLLLSLAGLIWRSIKRKPDVLEFFTLGYAILAIIWPWYLGFRMLIPLMPLLFFYAFYAINSAFKRRPLLATGISGILFLLWIIPYFYWYRKIEINLDKGFLHPGTIGMFDFIRKTPPDTRILFEKPRVIALYTGRAAMAKYCPATDELFAIFLKEQQITFLVVPKSEFQGETGCLKRWIARHPETNTLRYENKDFAVYQHLQ